MRSAYEAAGPASSTPIYDALYAEYRRLFRAVPGDRSGEEDLHFKGFGVRQGYGSPGVRAAGTGHPGHSGQTHGGHGYAAPTFAQGRQQGVPPAPGPPSAGAQQAAARGGGAAQGGTGWTQVGHLPQGHGTAPAGRHRGLLSLPPGRTGVRH